jgi:hypothetical protein
METHLQDRRYFGEFEKRNDCEQESGPTRRRVHLLIMHIHLKKCFFIYDSSINAVDRHVKISVFAGFFIFFGFSSKLFSTQSIYDSSSVAHLNLVKLKSIRSNKNYKGKEALNY